MIELIFVTEFLKWYKQEIILKFSWNELFEIISTIIDSYSAIITLTDKNIKYIKVRILW